jgi:hypothetical protein
MVLEDQQLSPGACAANEASTSRMKAGTCL